MIIYVMSNTSDNPYFLVSNKGKPLLMLNNYLFKKAKKLKPKNIGFVKQVDVVRTCTLKKIRSLQNPNHSRYPAETF